MLGFKKRLEQKEFQMDAPTSETTSRITLDVADNPDLRDLFARKEVGHECEIEVTFKLLRKGEETVEGSITKVSYEGHDDEPDMMTEPDRNSPVMIHMKGKRYANHGNPPFETVQSENPEVRSYA